MTPYTQEVEEALKEALKYAEEDFPGSVYEDKLRAALDREEKP